MPDIDAENIVITLREEEHAESGDAYIILLHKEDELWKEIRCYEFYTRYLELGELLKQKYGERLIDFEADYTVHLGGDSLSAFERVETFRKSLKSKKIETS